METTLDEVANFWIKYAVANGIDITEFINDIKTIYEELIIYAFDDTVRTYVNTINNIRRDKINND